jgi:hypothetical protein
MQDAAHEQTRTLLLRTRVNRGAGLVLVLYT